MATGFQWTDAAVLIAAISSAIAAGTGIWSTLHQRRQSLASNRESVLDIHAETRGHAPWLWVILRIQAKDQSFVLETIDVQKPANALIIVPDLSGTDIRDAPKIRRSTDFTQGSRRVDVNREVFPNHRIEKGFWYHWVPRRSIFPSRMRTRSSITLNLKWKNRHADRSSITVVIHATERQVTVQK